MPIKLGGSNIVDIKLGTTQITKVYLGSVLVWSKVTAPVFVSAATNTAGTIITVTFDKAMASPSGKHAQFSAIVAGAPRSITAAALNTDTTKIDLTLASTVTAGQVVTISYTTGDVVASDGGILASFSNQPVINNVTSAYQQWENYPQSPILTSSFPYQLIFLRLANPDAYYLAYAKFPLYVVGGYVYSGGTKLTRGYVFINNAWVSTTALGQTIESIMEANNDVYTDSSLTTVYFTKTTP